MATGDILSCTILATGWEAEIKIEGLSTGGTYALGDLDAADLSGAKVVFTVVSEGYSTSGVLGTTTRTVYGTRARMKVFPDHADAEERIDGSDVIVTLALSEFIYDDDKDGGAGTSGTNPTVTIGAGFYTEAVGDGGTANNAVTGLAVTNNSTLDYPKVIARWAVVPYQRFTSTFDLECVAFHKFATSGKPVACVKFESYEGASQVTEDIVTAMEKSSDDDSLPCYKQTITASNYTDNAVVTCQFTAYPWVGDADAIRTTVGGTANTLDLGPLPLLADSDDDVPIYYAVINTSTGNDTTGAASTTYATAAAAPYATIRKALGGIGTANGGSADFAEILIQSNNVPAFTGTSTAVTTTNGWVTITRDYKAASPIAKADAKIVGTGTNGVNTAHLRLYDLTLVPTGGMLTGLSGRVFWLDHVDTACASRITAKLSSAFDLTYNTFCTSDLIDFPHSHASTGNMAALIRGCTATHARGFVETPYNGNRCTLTSQILSPSAGQGSHILSLDQPNTIGAYCKHLACNWPPSVDNQKADETAMVCNVLEGYVDSSQQMIATTAKGDRSSFNQLVWHNTVAGDRHLIGYNCGDTIYALHNNRTHVNYSYKFNSDQWLATKHDVFAGEALDLDDASIYIGGWSVLYGVGSQGNNSEYTPDNFAPWWLGFKGTRATAAGYVNDQSLTTAGSGSGNYHPTEASVLVGKIQRAADIVIPYDIEGTAYAVGGAAGAYAEPPAPPAGSGYRFWTYS